MIGSIAEAAAAAIGCNGLLCRVGSYYHDIGKINKPTYFVENEMGSASRHKELSPAMSQLIIVGHVKDGIEMGKEYKLPAVIRQFISSHHGTTLVEPFYHEAKKQHESPDKDGKPKTSPPPRESEFRYVGPKPQNKESAIVMLADAVEGAVRSLTEVTPPRVETVVHNIIMRRLQDGQFDECDITLRELHRVEAAICKVLVAHYHGRIAYPTAADAAPEDKESQAVPQRV
jgi:putative nucleotidyltransferase with HDIG domain